MPTDDGDDLVKRVKETQWIWEDNKMKEKPITFVPILYKLFDEILLLSAVGSSNIIVNIDDGTRINIWSDGKSIPNVDSSLFGDALSLFGKFETQRAEGEWIYEKVLRDEKLESFKSQNTSNNMQWTTVTCEVDFKRIGGDCKDDIVALMKRRVVDLGGCCSSGLKVQLDDSPRSTTFEDYANLYLQRSSAQRVYAKVDRWDICVSVADGAFKQVSFLNNISTVMGGPHVDYITEQITDYLAPIMNLKPNDIKSHLWVFVNAHDNELTLNSKSSVTSCNSESWRSKCQLTLEFLEQIKGLLFSKRNNDDNEAEISVMDVIDAKLANTAYSQYCTLVIVEGKSAGNFPSHGLSIIGAQTYGVYTLQGLLMNVREANADKLAGNTQTQDIQKMLGLQDKNKTFSDITQLRYGRILIMADQDHDGSRIKGLIINMFQFLFPLLVKLKDFISMFITPIVVAKNRQNQNVTTYYTIRDYEENMGTLGDDYEVCYYKGLASHTSDEAISYFQQIDDHVQYFLWEDDDDDRVVVSAFSKAGIHYRRRLVKEKNLTSKREVDIYNPHQRQIRYVTFFNTMYKDFLIDDVERSVPSMVDGLTIAKRKILHFALSMTSDSLDTEKMNGGTSVEIFCAFVAERTLYRHAVTNLQNTVQVMSDSTKNNITLLHLEGLMDAKARYPKTKLHHLTRFLFHEVDEAILSYLYDNVTRLEPRWFIPIIPLILVNGGKGVSAAYSTTIPCYNPREIIANLIRRMKNEEMRVMVPWHKGSDTDTKVTAISGMYALDKDGGVKKYATPIDLLEDFFVLRLGLYDQRKTHVIQALKRTSLLLENRKNYILAVWNASLVLPKNVLPENMKQALCEEFNRQGFRTLPSIMKEAKGEPQVDEDVSVSGYTGYDYLMSINAHGVNPAEERVAVANERKLIAEKIQRLTTYDPESVWIKDLAILDEELATAGFPEAEYTCLQELKIASLQLESKVRFAHEVLNGDLVLSKKPKKEKCIQLRRLRFKSLPSIKREARDKPQEEEDVTAKGYDGYDYLLSLPTESFQHKYIEDLKEERKANDKKIEHLTTSTSMSLRLKNLASSL